LAARRDDRSAALGAEAARLALARKDLAEICDRSAVSDLLTAIAVDGSHGDRLDRERQETDALVAESPPPKLPRVQLKLEQQRPELFVIGPLPRQKLVLSVTCGRFASGPVEVELRFGFSGPLVVTMHPVDGGVVHGQ